MLLPVLVGVTVTEFKAVFIADTDPSNVTVELLEAPDTSVVVPAVYETVPALAVTVARTVSPLAQVLVFKKVEPSPRLRADDAVAASDREKSKLVTVRDETGSNSTIAEEMLHVSAQSFHTPPELICPKSSPVPQSLGSPVPQLLYRLR